jgi:hypothetical protein
MSRMLFWLKAIDIMVCNVLKGLKTVGNGIYLVISFFGRFTLIAIK